VDLQDYRLLGEAQGTLGLITLNKDVFLCVVTTSSRAATVKPGETILRIDNVEFHCLNRADYTSWPEHEAAPRAAHEDLNYGAIFEGRDAVTDHPFSGLKKLLSDGSFYYSLDFNLTDRLQNRPNESATIDIDSLDEDLLWNSYMIGPLLLFRSQLAIHDRRNLDSSRILTSVIRGFTGTLTIPASIPLLPKVRSNLPSTLTIVSRLSSRRAGTRFNSRGLDDDGNVANFVETETVLWCPPGISFSYTQIRGSVPVFWEQPAGLLPGQQKIEITRSSEATQYAFDKHLESLELKYGAVHIINLLCETKPGEAELSARFREHLANSLRLKDDAQLAGRHLMRSTEFDFHAETRGPLGYEGSTQIRPRIEHSLSGFAYFLSENDPEAANASGERSNREIPMVILQQEGVFRTNCLDCLDRTNLVQTIISSMALDLFFSQYGGMLTQDFQMRHSSLWADNGDALSKIYAGTGALKTSFTRHGKMSLAGAFADARKSATRLYVNTFADKERQHTLDLLLGRLTNQDSVHLYDPVNDMVTAELDRRIADYTSTRKVRIWVGTFNLNGRCENVDLSPWIFPPQEAQYEDPVIVAIAFQEIVELSPQQIMSTDPTPRIIWEAAVKKCLNSYSDRRGTPNYVLLRSGQLVGTALSIFVKEDELGDIKNVEGSVKKTGLSGMAGNKGGCAIRFEYSNTRLCFVTAHLAAGFANYDERNRDYSTISHGLRFQKNRTIEDHDTIIWLGDFNYRIGLGDQRVREFVRQKQYDILYENDQLNLQMIAGRTFPFYSEGVIRFPPTYKYNIGTDDYDTSEKARIPAWCDRVLWKGSNLKQKKYEMACLRFSDHRPVWASFECMISIVDEQMKGALREALFNESHREVNRLTPSKTGDDEDADSMIYRPIAPGYPSASSDSHKWWLDEGAQVRSQIKPPTKGEIPNIHRISNPFSPNDEPDWIQLQFSSARSKPSVGRLNPLPTQVEQATEVNEGSHGATRSNIEALLKVSEDSRLLRPQIPNKPISLSAQQAAGKNDNPLSRSLTSASRYSPIHKAEWNPVPSDGADEYSKQFPHNDDHRNVEGLKNPIVMSQTEQSQAPPAPRRSQSAMKRIPANNLLDDEFDGAIENWRPLTPRR
jgi:hypothetical protein